MKKSLLITLDFPPDIGGVGNYLYNLCSNFPNNNITVLTQENKFAKFDHKINILRKKLILKNIPIWPKWILLFFHVHDLVRIKKYQFLMAGQILPIGTVCYLIKKLLKVPYLVFTYGMDITFSQYSKRKTNLIKKILKNADYVITISEYTKNELLKLGVEENKITKVFPCANFTPSTPDLSRKNQIVNKYDLFNKKIILTVGRLEERKGQDMVIKSLPKILEKIKNIKYLIIGNGPYKEKLLDLIKENNLENHVHIISNVINEDLNVFYNLSDVFIMPSREIKFSNGKIKDFEGFGIVFLEANLYEKPVIGGKSGGQPDAIQDGYSGLLVNPESKDEIAEAIVKLLTDRELYAKLGKQGRQRVLSKFHWKNEANKIIDLLK